MEPTVALVISSSVREKLNNKQPPVTQEEIEQCFANRIGKFLIDTRADNLTNPLTRWFVSETDYGRKLKVCFMPFANGEIHVKTAYDPNEKELRIYADYGENHGND